MDDWVLNLLFLYFLVLVGFMVWDIIDDVINDPFKEN